ncbi:MAG: glutamate decarboxylase [Clostridia bacterium]|nr:glutamate decarboxylase [Clostridia bacterium]
MRSPNSAPWRVIYIARGEEQAHQIEALLSQAGFLCDWKRPAQGGGRTEDIEIKALESEAEEARLYLMEQGL